MKVEITYCAPCGYLPTTIDVAKALLTRLPRQVDELSLVPGKGGVFDIRVDGELVHSKGETGRLPDPEEVLELAEAHSRA